MGVLSPYESRLEVRRATGASEQTDIWIGREGFGSDATGHRVDVGTAQVEIVSPPGSVPQ
jgi:hypothetical protein